GNDVFVIDVRHNGDDLARLGADADEFYYAISPPHLAIHRILGRVQHVGEALANDHHAFVAVLVAVIEVSAVQNGHAHRLEPSRRDRAEDGAEILSILTPCTLRRKREADAPFALIAPWRT